MRKKAFKNIVVIGMISTMLVGTVGCGNSSSDTTEAPEQEPVVSVEPVLSADDEADSSEVSEPSEFYVGDTITLNDGTDINILETGMHNESDAEGTDHTYVYVKVDIANNGTDDINIDATQAEFYADDYKMENGFPTNVVEGYEAFDNETISAGRKIQGCFYAECSNYDEVSVIEMELANNIVVVEDITLDDPVVLSAGTEDVAAATTSDATSTTTDATDTTSASTVTNEELTYGTYEYDSADGNVYYMEVMFSTETEGDYIRVWNDAMTATYGDLLLAELERNADGSYTGYDCTYKIVLTTVTLSFHGGEVVLNVVDTDSDVVPQIAGTYKLVSATDTAHVG